ncbi:MAG: alpha/beta family hydrolase [Candidatus Nanopelagicales bacterium]
MAVSREPVVELVATPVGDARLTVHAVARPRALVVLGHGAGRGTDTADLLGLAEDLPRERVAVVLVDQPWVLAGRRVAAPPATLDVAWVAALSGVRRPAGVGAGTPRVVGGSSAGARVACRTAAEVGARGVLLLAVPLLPPAARSSAAKRDAALATRLGELALPAAAGLPVVAAQGSRDACGSATELAAAAGDLLEVVEVDDADHSLRTRAAGPDPRPTLLAAALRAVALARGE